MASTFQLHKASDGQFRFDLLASNGKIIFSSEPYQAKASAQEGIDAVRRNVTRAGAFEVRASSSGKHYFTLSGADGFVIGQSQVYSNPASCVKGMQAVLNAAPEAVVRDEC